MHRPPLGRTVSYWLQPSSGAGSGGVCALGLATALTEVFDEHQIAVQAVYLRVQHGVAIGRNADAELERCRCQVRPCPGLPAYRIEQLQQRQWLVRGLLQVPDAFECYRIVRRYDRILYDLDGGSAGRRHPKYRARFTGAADSVVNEFSIRRLAWSHSSITHRADRDAAR